MTVLEITHLSLPSTSPHNTRALLPILQTVRANLAEKVHPTNSRFFSTISPKDTSQQAEGIYILGSWRSVAAHREFLADDGLRDEILGSQEGALEFVEGIHVKFESGEVEDGGMNNQNLPLGAPVIVLERIETNGGDLKKDKGLEEATKPWVVFDGRRSECDCDGSCSCPDMVTESARKEFVRMSGWESRGAYQEWREKSRTIVSKEGRGLVGIEEVMFLFGLESD